MKCLLKFEFFAIFLKKSFILVIPIIIFIMKKGVFRHFLNFILLMSLFLLFVVIINALVADDDEDGVPDEFDLCSGSDTHVVDQSGCSCAQKNCPSDGNDCTDDCSIISRLPACVFTNNDEPCEGGYCDGGECVSEVTPIATPIPTLQTDEIKEKCGFYIANVASGAIISTYRYFNLYISSNHEEFISSVNKPDWVYLSSPKIYPKDSYSYGDPVLLWTVIAPPRGTEKGIYAFQLKIADNNGDIKDTEKVCINVSNNAESIQNTEFKSGDTIIVGVIDVGVEKQADYESLLEDLIEDATSGQFKDKVEYLGQIDADIEEIIQNKKFDILFDFIKSLGKNPNDYDYILTIGQAAPQGFDMIAHMEDEFFDNIKGKNLVNLLPVSFKFFSTPLVSTYLHEISHPLSNRADLPYDLIYSPPTAGYLESTFYSNAYLSEIGLEPHDRGVYLIVEEFGYQETTQEEKIIYHVHVRNTGKITDTYTISIDNDISNEESVVTSSDIPNKGEIDKQDIMPINKASITFDGKQTVTTSVNLMPDQAKTLILEIDATKLNSGLYGFEATVESTSNNVKIDFDKLGMYELGSSDFYNTIFKKENVGDISGGLFEVKGAKTPVPIYQQHSLECGSQCGSTKCPSYETCITEYPDDEGIDVYETNTCILSSECGATCNEWVEKYSNILTIGIQDEPCSGFANCAEIERDDFGVEVPCEDGYLCVGECAVPLPQCTTLALSCSTVVDNNIQVRWNGVDAAKYNLEWRKEGLSFDEGCTGNNPAECGYTTTEGTNVLSLDLEKDKKYDFRVRTEQATTCKAPGEWSTTVTCNISSSIFDVYLLPINYNDHNDFKTRTDTMTSYFLRYSPFSECTSRVNFVVPDEDKFEQARSSEECTGILDEDVLTSIPNCASVLYPEWDAESLVGIAEEKIGSSSQGISGPRGTFRLDRGTQFAFIDGGRPGYDGDILGEDTFLHELGHGFGACEEFSTRQWNVQNKFYQGIFDVSCPNSDPSDKPRMKFTSDGTNDAIVYSKENTCLNILSGDECGTLNCRSCGSVSREDPNKRTVYGARSHLRLGLSSEFYNHMATVANEKFGCEARTDHPDAQLDELDLSKIFPTINIEDGSDIIISDNPNYKLGESVVFSSNIDFSDVEACNWKIYEIDTFGNEEFVVRQERRLDEMIRTDEKKDFNFLANVCGQEIGFGPGIVDWPTSVAYLGIRFKDSTHKIYRSQTFGNVNQQTDGCENKPDKGFTVQCPDGFTSTCTQTCQNGEYTTCTPDCSGHQQTDSCENKPDKDLTIQCTDGFTSTCTQTCQNGEYTTCTPDCSGHEASLPEGATDQFDLGEDKFSHNYKEAGFENYPPLNRVYNNCSPGGYGIRGLERGDYIEWEMDVDPNSNEIVLELQRTSSHARQEYCNVYIDNQKVNDGILDFPQGTCSRVRYPFTDKVFISDGKVVVRLEDNTHEGCAVYPGVCDCILTYAWMYSESE
jgi:hypothetical protein